MNIRLFAIFFLCLIFLLKNEKIIAQQPNYIHYTLQNGLPSMQVYSIMQDQNGFIWLATAMGASCFNGQEFTNYTTADGLPSNHVLDIKQDKTGKIWMLAANGRTCYLKNQQIYTDTSPIFGKKLPQTGDIIIDYQASLLSLQDRLEQNILSNQKKYFKQAISCQFKESEADIWLGTWGGGAFYCVDYQSNKLKVQSYLANKIITSILKDKEGNYWFSTLDEGVFLLTNRQMLAYTTKDGLAHNELHALAQDNKGNIWAGNSKGGISKITKNRISNIHFNANNKNYNRINDISIDKSNNKWISSDKGLKLYYASGREKIISNKAVKKTMQTRKNTTWVVSYQNPFELSKKNEVITVLPLQKVNSIAEDDKGTIWFGTARGLSHYVNDTSYYWGSKYKILGKNITDLAWKNDKLWIATDGYGILVKQEDKLMHLTTEHGLSSNICRAIFIDDKNDAWIASSKGINHLKINGLDAKSLSINHYTYTDGLASDHVNDIYVDGDKVWVATLKGLTFFRKSDIKKRAWQPPIFIQNVKVWNKNQPLKARYYLPYDQNNIHLHYIGLSYQSDGEIRYQYTMEGIDTIWHMTSLNQVQYPLLPSGKYVFKVLAIDKNGQKSAKTAKVHLHIALPFWKTWFFYTLLIIIFLGLSILSIYLSIQYFKNRNELRRRLVESEQMALRAQMNPHFIFNSLNSIQYFITENDKKSANIYLSTFATLIRTVLINSQKSSIFLEDELEYIKLYLAIESLRFKDKFKYNIHINKDISLDEVKIPPMLIQPYIENAIQHGLLQKKEGNRLLKIDFQELTDDILLCTLTDNGIGREKAVALQKRSGGGIGTTNPKERLSILNRLNKAQIRVVIIDLYDGHQNPTGTQVKISIPIFYD